MSATNRGAKRSEYDSYQTPWYCVAAVMRWFDWGKVSNFLEPCKGEGRIYTSVPTGVRRTWCEIAEGRDYLDFKPRTEYDLIVTNPPFSLGLEFIMKSLAEARTVSYLLRNNWLGSIDREEFFYHNNPDYVWTLAPRPSFKDGKTDACEYAWITWDRGGLVLPSARRFMTIGRTDKGSNKVPVPCSGIILPPSLRPAQEEGSQRTHRRTRKVKT